MPPQCHRRGQCPPAGLWLCSLLRLPPRLPRPPHSSSREGASPAVQHSGHLRLVPKGSSGQQLPPRAQVQPGQAHSQPGPEGSAVGWCHSSAMLCLGRLSTVQRGQWALGSAPAQGLLCPPGHSRGSLLPWERLCCSSPKDQPQLLLPDHAACWTPPSPRATAGSRLAPGGELCSWSKRPDPGWEAQEDETKAIK